MRPIEENRQWELTEMPVNNLQDTLLFIIYQ